MFLDDDHTQATAATEAGTPTTSLSLRLLRLALLAGAAVVGAAALAPTEGAIGAARESDRGLAFEAVQPMRPAGHDVRPGGTLWCEYGLRDFHLGCVQRVGTLWCEHDLSDDGGASRLRHLGDFNGDGKDDVLLRHQDGSWHYYAMDGRRVLPDSGAVDLELNLDWQIAGIGDFDGDGKDDVLLRRGDGNPWYLYLLDGRNVRAHYETYFYNGIGYGPVHVGDFDGDGRDDLLLRSETHGAWYYYRMNGWRVLRGSGPARLTRDLAWQVTGIADFDRDGKDDLLLRHEEGRWYFYPMNGRAPKIGSGGVALTRNLAWQVVGVGNFDRDVRKNVLLRHPSGRWRHYGMQGRQVVVGPQSVNLTDDTSSTVAGIGDLNGDGVTDVLTRLADGGWEYNALYDANVASLWSGTAALSEDLAWGVLSCDNRVTGTRLPGRTLIDAQDETISLSRAFGRDHALTYQVRSSEPDVLRASVTGDVLTLMPVGEGTSTVTVTGRDPDGNSATQAFAARFTLNRFRDCAECPTMVIMPAGTFTMGAPESELDSGYDGGTRAEQPQRTVSIPAFAVSAHEVTFAQWDACAAAGACPVLFICSSGSCETILPDYSGVCLNDPNRCSTWQLDPDGRAVYYPDDNGWGRRNRPVINVDWFNARQYVDWLSRRFGQPYRLLTESEWEYAARAGTTTPFHTGEAITSDQANYDGRCSYGDIDTQECNESWHYRRETVPVGSFPPNRFGLYDMHGNVWEWVQDCYGSYSTAPNDGSARDGCNRWDTWSVLRGGSWRDPAVFVRSAQRNPADARYREIDIGFRVARTLKP